MELYIKAYGLTYLRVYALIWMRLVGAGLALTLWQVVWGRDYRSATSPHRVTPILDLSDRIALERVCEFSSGHRVLLASKITKQGVYKSRGYSHRPCDA